jgi:hypothetical protein
MGVACYRYFRILLLLPGMMTHDNSLKAAPAEACLRK